MGIRFFFHALEQVVRRAPTGATAAEVLDRAIDRAMVDRSRRPAFRLRPGEGAEARARILIAAGRLGLVEPSMLSGETVGEWLGRGLRERLDQAQLVTLVRTARGVRGVRLADLEARAP